MKISTIAHFKTIKELREMLDALQDVTNVGYIHFQLQSELEEELMAEIYTENPGQVTMLDDNNIPILSETDPTKVN